MLERVCPPLTVERAPACIRCFVCSIPLLPPYDRIVIHAPIFPLYKTIVSSCTFAWIFDFQRWNSRTSIAIKSYSIWFTLNTKCWNIIHSGLFKTVDTMHFYLLSRNETIEYVEQNNSVTLLLSSVFENNIYMWHNIIKRNKQGRN